jgi:peptide subunit release factor 1 (eRF1)
MQYDVQKVSDFIASIDKKDLSGQELIAVGKALQALGEVQKETDYLDEYLQKTLLSDDVFGGNGGGTLN